MPRRQLPQILLIIFAGAVCYANSLHVPFVMDDMVISALGPIPPLEHLLHGTVRRFADFTFSLNYHLHGLNPAGYHIANLAIHLSAAVTLFYLIAIAMTALRLTWHMTETENAAERFVPAAAALLFAVHPLQTQAVTYIAQRYTCLATLFYLLAALLFVRARLALERAEPLIRILAPAGGCLLAGILALGSKQIAATLPMMLMALEICLFRGRLLNRRFFLFCGAGLLVGGIALMLVSPDGLLTTLQIATAEDRTISRIDYLLTQTRVVATYLRLLILPYGQSIFHDIPLSTSISLPVLAATVLHLGILGGAALLFRAAGKEQGEKGILLRLSALGICWFYIALIVESSIFPITDRVFEHRVYLPSAGFFLAVAAIGTLAIAGRGDRLRRGWALLLIIAVILGGLTLNRNRLWGNSLLLWQDTVAKAPNKDLALANLAGEYMKIDQPEKALPLFVRALEINPRFMTVTKIYLGLTLQRLNMDTSRFSAGEELLEAAQQRPLSLDEANRLDTLFYNCLGLAQEQLGMPEKARFSYLNSLKVNPAYDRAWYNLGLLAAQQGNQTEATAALTQLQRFNPALAERLAAETGGRP